MRISDWSSDVCSSDLSAAAVVPLTVPIPDNGTGRAAADYVHFQTFSTPFDEETRELREEAIRRPALDRKSVVKGKSVSVRVDLGGRRIIKKKNKKKQ